MPIVAREYRNAALVGTKLATVWGAGGPYGIFVYARAQRATLARMERFAPPIGGNVRVASIWAR